MLRVFDSAALAERSRPPATPNAPTSFSHTPLPPPPIPRLPARANSPGRGAEVKVFVLGSRVGMMMEMEWKTGNHGSADPNPGCGRHRFFWVRAERESAASSERAVLARTSPDPHSLKSKTHQRPIRAYEIEAAIGGRTKYGHSLSNISKRPLEVFHFDIRKIGPDENSLVGARHECLAKGVGHSFSQVFTLLGTEFPGAPEFVLQFFNRVFRRVEKNYLTSALCVSNRKQSPRSS